MLHPKLFGYDSHYEMLGALSDGKELTADSLHFWIKPDSEGGFQTRSTGDMSFPQTFPELMRVMTWLCREKNSGGMPYNGFLVTDLDGNPVDPEVEDSVNYDEGAELFKKHKGQAFLVPIFRGERAEFKQQTRTRTFDSGYGPGQ